MPRQKKGKARQQALVPEGGGGEADLAPIPEDTNGYEGYDQYGQGGEAWQPDENAYGGGYDDGYPQGGQWGGQPGAQTEAWDAGQYPQQGYGPPPPMTSPVNVNAPQTPGPSAFAAWGRNPQDAYGAPRPPHTASQPSPAAPPPRTLPPRSRQDSGAAAGAPGWQNWGAEAMAMNNKNLVPPSPQPQGRGYGQQSRVAFASPYAPFEDRADATPQAQHMIYDSITSSHVGAPKQPHQRSARGSAQNSTHTGKHLKRSKKEKRAQGQSAPNGWSGQQDNPAWGQENPGWGQENTQWDQGGYGYDQQGVDLGEKQDFAADQWGAGQVGRDDLDSEGNTDSDGWNDVTGRRNFRRTVSNAFVPGPAGNSPYPMPSRTMAYANGTLEEDPLEAFSPGLSRKRNTMHDFADIELLESYGESLKPVEHAFFGRDRKARDRIHWQFPFDKDERVRHALEWLHDYAHDVGAFGLNKFLQTRERGALFINASYDNASGNGPTLDWLSYEDVVETRDRLLQESVGFYDPSMQVIVFVFLPSKSGNSLAMWRRKVAVPNSVRLAHLREIDLAKAALRRDYPVLVDEIRSPPYRPSSLQTHSAPPSTKKKKKKGFFRRLFRIFKIVW